MMKACDPLAHCDLQSRVGASRIDHKYLVCNLSGAGQSLSNRSLGVKRKDDDYWLHLLTIPILILRSI